MNETLKSFSVDGCEMLTTTTKKFDNRKKWEKPNPNIISSFIPGTILDLKVKVGDKVKKGQIILTLESMKMANNIASPVDGKVKSISVEKGAIIPKGTVMVEIE